MIREALGRWMPDMEASLEVDGQHRPSDPTWSAMAMRMRRSMGARSLAMMARTLSQYFGGSDVLAPS